MALLNVKSWSQQQLYGYKQARWRAHTDLGFLCREVLGYPDVSDTIHGPIIKLLQQFPVPDKQQFCDNDQISSGYVKYTPILDMTSLPGKRRRLILDPRGWLKTTVNAQAHTIQWILNYPDIAMQVVQSNLDKAEIILAAIKNQFTRNPTFRNLFPEHCPQRKMEDWGTKGQFTSEARPKTSTRSVPTVMIGSIDKQMAGLHFDVMKFSDIVEDSNTGTDDQIYEVIRSYHMMKNLLVAPGYWIDIEGTRYTFNDLYGSIIKAETAVSPEEREWAIHVRGCYKKKYTPGVAPAFTPEELDLPDYLNEKGEKELHWFDEKRGLTLKHYEAMRRADPYGFSTQQLNCPSATGDGKSVFPVNNVFPKYISEKDFKQNVRVAYYLASIDTAETINKRSNSSVITVAAVASDGRHYVVEILRGKFLPDELLKHITEVVDRYYYKKGDYGARLRAVNLEKTSFTTGLMVAIRQWEQTHRKSLFIQLIPRDTQIAKVTRIQNTLQAPYNSGRLIFLKSLETVDGLGKPVSSEQAGQSVMAYALTELKEFPLGTDDDILDTLADLFQGREWFGREQPRPSFEQVQAEAWDRFLGMEDLFDPNWTPGGDFAQIHNKAGY